MIFERLRTDRVAELPILTDELLDWISAYRSPAARIGVARTAPPHRPAEPAHFLESAEKRARVLGAVVHLTLDEGYNGLTDPQIAQFAGMSTESFTNTSPSKQECFVAVVDEFVDETIAAIAAGASQADSWPEAAYLGVRAGIDHFVAHPGLTKMAFVDLFDVGPVVTDCIGRTLGKLGTMLQETSPEPRRAPLLAHRSGGRCVVDDHRQLRDAQAREVPAVADRPPRVHGDRPVRGPEGGGTDDRRHPPQPRARRALLVLSATPPTGFRQIRTPGAGRQGGIEAGPIVGPGGLAGSITAPDEVGPR